ncbi:MAG: RidA family protein [Trueperaceae bacterium]|nr:RidA family protein [Trueperaceae bacterium]MCC6310452.1 RidA family protein [Trueperaceae bacterium]MCO5174893.1 RidA family protein [Trueperaceae bacterium]MCW5819885.1 RidA family protein [Trueperaceae bacterium]
MHEIIATETAPKAIGPYSQAVKVGGLVFTAGQIALEPDGTWAGGDITAQTHQVMRNLTAVLEAAGTGVEHIVKSTCFLADMNDFAAFNEVYGSYLKGNLPARSTVQAAGLPKGGLVEVEVIASLP